MSNSRGQLTRYAPGSVQELWAVSFPVILSLLSVNVMIFIDRLILSKYGTQAMNAAVIAELVFNVFQLGAVEITSISDIFVGQFNGARKYKQIGEVVWQMIWFSVGSLLFFLPMSLFAGPYLLPNAEHVADGLPFFKCIMLFGPFFLLYAALASFFIGQGRVKLVMTVTILSNLLNVLWDFVLIFGVEGIIPALGSTGAAIATGVAQMTQATILLVIFLRPCHRRIYGTGIWHFKPKVFWQVFQAGYPRAVAIIMELTAWSVLSQIVARMSEAHITAFSIGDSFYTLFAFSFLGVQKGVTAVIANYVGANREGLMGHCLMSGIKIILGMVLLFSLPLLFFSEVLVEQFLWGQVAGQVTASAGAGGPVISEELMTYACHTLRWLWVYFVLDALSWAICGALTAVNDTKYIMMVNTLSIWVFGVLPSYFCLFYLNSSPTIPWMFCALAGLVNVASFYLRYRGWRGRASQAAHVYI